MEPEVDITGKNIQPIDGSLFPELLHQPPSTEQIPQPKQKVSANYSDSSDLSGWLWAFSLWLPVVSLIGLAAYESAQINYAKSPTPIPTIEMTPFLTSTPIVIDKRGSQRLNP